MECEAPVSFESFFRLARQEVQSSGWHGVDLCEPPASLRSVAWREDPENPEAALLRVVYEIELPLEEAYDSLRPEVFLSWRHAEFQWGIEECGIEEILAPGDATGWMRLTEAARPYMQRTALFLSSAESSQKVLDKYGWLERKMRMAIRREFPLPNTRTVVLAPRHIGTGEVVEEWGAWKAVIGILQVHAEDANKTTVVGLQRVNRGSVWSLPKVASAVPRIQFYRVEMDRNKEYRKSEAFKLTLAEAKDYVVVTVRRCQKGPPLLPTVRFSEVELIGRRPETTESCWKTTERIDMPGYLRQFLRCLDLQDVRVHDSLDGRRLMHYQAVVGSKDWDRVWAALEEPFKAQRAAYRHVYQTKAAPVLELNTEPRLMALEEQAQLDSHAPPGLDEVSFVVQRTFVQVAGLASRGSASKRSGSASRIQRSADRAVELAQRTCQSTRI